MTCPLNLSLWSVSNFPNQLYYCMTLIISWLKGWMNGGLHSESESLSKLYLCEDVCLGLCDCACSACLWMHVCNCVWSKPAVAGLWIRSNTHTHTHIVTPDQTYAYTHTDCHWTELEGPNRVWLWSSPQHPLLHSNTAFCYSTVSCPPHDTYPGLKLLPSHLQIELSVVSNIPQM